MWSQTSFPPLKHWEKMTVFTNMFSDSGIAFGIHKGMLNFHVIVVEKWAMNLWVPHVKTVVLADIFLSLLWTELSRPGPFIWISSNDKSHFAAGCCYCTVAHLCPTLCDPMDCSTSGFPVHHHLLEFAQTHVHWVGGAIQPSHPLSSHSPPAFNLSQHQGLFQWVGSLHQVAKVLEFQLQHQSFQWIFRVNFL